jgi:hypothetical protein
MDVVKLNETLHAERLGSAVSRLAYNVSALLALRYRETDEIVPSTYSCYFLSSGPFGTRLGLDQFFRELTPGQTGEILIAILEEHIGVMSFGAAARQCPEARKHFLALYENLNDFGRRAMHDAGWL